MSVVHECVADRWWDIKLALERKLLPWYISKQCIHYCLARDYGTENTRDMCALLSKQSTHYCGNRTVWLTSKCVNCVTQCSSHSCNSEKLISTISVLWECNRSKSSYRSWWQMHLSLKSRLLIPHFLQQKLFRPKLFLVATSGHCPMAKHQLVHQSDHAVINVA